MPLATWLSTNLGWFFLFAPGNLPVLTGTIFTGGVVLAVMILPIITAVTREVFSQAPRFHIEAAQALGATRWEVIRMAVLPYGRSGYIAGSMLGLGRALGETIAVLIVIRAATTPSGFSLFDGGYTFASLIASAASEFSQPLPTGAYIAAGLVLFILTFVVNAIARDGRRREGERLMSTATGLNAPERPATTPTFQAPSTGRKIKNNLATFLVGLAFVIAVVPLVWVLATVVVRGIGAHPVLGLVEQVAVRCAARVVRRRRLPRDLRHADPGAAGGGHRRARSASWPRSTSSSTAAGAWRRPPASWWTSSPACPRSSPRCSSSRRSSASWASAQSAFMVSLALVLLMLPVVIRNTEEMLRLVPDELREAAYALGIPKWKTILRIVLPTALSGTVTGVMLALARVMGETAPVLVLVGYSQSINFDPFSGNMASLPLLMFSELSNPEPSGQFRIWGAALTLILIIMILQLGASVVSRFSAISK